MFNPNLPVEYVLFQICMSVVLMSNERHVEVNEGQRSEDERLQVEEFYLHVSKKIFNKGYIDMEIFKNISHLPVL